MKCSLQKKQDGLVRRALTLLNCLTCLATLGFAHIAWAGTELKDAVKTSGKHHTSIPVTTAEQSTSIPITVVKGESSGKTLLVIAGIHGSEYAPILAGQRFANTLDPASLAGTVIIVHIANLPAYLGRTIYTSPVDGLNLNRLFPGKADGSLSERIAHVLTSQLYPLADAVLDVHSGDGNEDLRPFWTGYYAQAGDPEVIGQSRAMAHAFGLEYIVPFQWELKDPKDAIWAGSAAVAMNIPSIDVEAGGMGIVDDDAVAAIEEGFHRILALMGITQSSYQAPENQKVLFDRQSIKSPVDGSWVALKSAGNPVSDGELLGYVTDLHGRRVFDVRSPKDGLLMLRLSAPPVQEGETLVMVASTRAAE
ncbi:MAG: M14 family metallopeptidase [Pseudomonadota bacterium]